MDVAEKLRKTHKQEHPDYKYQPRRKKGRSLTSHAIQCGDGLTAEALTAAAAATLINCSGNKPNEVKSNTNGKKATNNHLSSKSLATTAENRAMNGRGAKPRGREIQRQQQQQEQQHQQQLLTQQPQQSSSKSTFVMDINETLKNSCQSVALLTQGRLLGGNGPTDESSDFVFHHYDYSKSLDSPCSTVSSVQSCGTTPTDSQPLTPPATPYARSNTIVAQPQQKHQQQQQYLTQPQSGLQQQVRGEGSIGGLSEYNLHNIEGREFITLDDCAFTGAGVGGDMNEGPNHLSSYALQCYANPQQQHNSLEFQNYVHDGGIPYSTTTTATTTYRPSTTNCASSSPMHSIEPLNYFNISKPNPHCTIDMSKAAAMPTNGHNYMAPFATDPTSIASNENEDVDVSIEQYFMDQIMPIEPNATTMSTVLHSTSHTPATTMAITTSVSSLRNSTKNVLYIKAAHEITHAPQNHTAGKKCCLPPTPSTSSASCSSPLATASSLPSPQKFSSSSAISSSNLPASTDSLNCFFLP